MIDLLKNYNVQDIFIFCVLLALALKGGISFFDWLSKRLFKAMNKANKPNELERNLEKNTEAIKQLQNNLTQLTKLINILVESDKDAIKAFITHQHHYFCYQRGQIDDYSLDCIEKRYSHYEQQGGNSFVKNLMIEIRQLPRHASALTTKQRDQEARD